jgi:SAM-dependent methyltransferase
MTTDSRQAHWQKVYSTKSENDVSWFEESPELSLALIEAAHAGRSAAIADIGGGASRLVDELLDRGYSDVTVLDLSERALAVARARLGKRADMVDWVIADVTTWEPRRRYDVWHDRAAFHFLIEPDERAAYVQRVIRALSAGGHVIIGTFAPDGPEICSGLPVFRCDAGMLAEILGQSFQLTDSRRYDHRTPGGAMQRFQFSTFRRTR